MRSIFLRPFLNSGKAEFISYLGANDPDRLEMNKYCKFCKKHTLHKETK